MLEHNELREKFSIAIEFLSKHTNEKTVMKRCRYFLRRNKQKNIIKQYCADTRENVCVILFNKQEENIVQNFLDYYFDKYLSKDEKERLKIAWILFKEIKETKE